METYLHFCEGFCFPGNSFSFPGNSTTSLRIQNHDWVVCQKMSQAVCQNYNYKRQLLIEFQRPVCTESVDIHLIIFAYVARVAQSGNWDKVMKNFTFPKSQKKIEVSIRDYSFEYSDQSRIDSLIGMVSVTFLDSSKTDEKKSKVERYSAAVSSQLSKHFAKLLDSDASSDYALRCAGQEFHVHKCILAARSSVFAAMFHFHNKNAEVQTKFETKSNGGQKKTQDGIQETSAASNKAEDIVDLKPEILLKMLKYIYAGQIDDLTCTDAGDLLYAADKYQLALLKEICVDKLKSTLTANNVLDSLVLGDLHDQSLKAHAMDFICKYPSLSELKKMDQWKSLQTTNPTMVIEVLTSVVGYLQDSKK